MRGTGKHQEGEAKARPEVVMVEPGIHVLNGTPTDDIKSNPRTKMLCRTSLVQG
jgi:hypothetical protein